MHALLLAVLLAAAAPDDLPATLADAMRRFEGVGFSGVALVAKDGEILLHEGYGLADREAGRPVTKDTVFTVGSITKQFTGAAILKLQELGKLDVHDPIAEHLPGVPEDKRAITIHHLLTHTSGLVGGLGGDWDTDATRERTLADALASELLWEPGTAHRYSNLGYSLAAMIVERASGQGYEAFLREHLFEPAGMTRTGYLLPEYDEAELAVGYQDGERWGTVLGRPMLDDGPCWNLRGNGGIHATAADMLRWHEAIERGDVLSEASVRAWQAPHAREEGADSHYGYGWSLVETPRDTTLVAHNGANGVFFADFLRYVDEGLVVFVATNVADRAEADIGGALAALAFGREADLPPATVPLGDAERDALLGAWVLDDGARLHVAADPAAGLLLSTPDARAAALLGAGAPVEDARLLEGMARLAEVTLRGDVGPLREAMGGAIPAAQLEALRADVLDPLADSHGAFVGAGTGAATIRDGLLRVTVRLDFERGTHALVLLVRDGVVRFVTDAPRVEAARLRVFPVAPGRFVAWDGSGRVDLAIAFDDDGLVLESGGEALEGHRPAP